ncbi:olfactory receptor 4K3 [Sorex fumeus]|uniref:olfactory receptor 4K3 n=1 Tax=Sorex fumeus TaxID=62283 RepID=UPI0024ADDCE1|nr:olfactory receptor 4K3 [Sorex fumeus]
MAWNNQSVVREFILQGLSSSWELQIFYFLFFSAVYAATVLGNLLIVLTIMSEPRLHTPMYFLLGNLSFIDMSLASFATPKMIADFLSEHKAISFEGCITQIFFLHLLGGVEIVLLISMSFDRYVAICKPLRYLTIMSHKTCIGLVALSWIVGIFHAMSQLAFTVNLPFCGPNKVDSFFCDLPLVIKLACVDTYILGVFMISTSGLIALVCFILLVISYTIILVTVRQRSSGGSSKALSTCSAHFTVVTLFFGPCIFIYVWPFTNFPIDKVLSVFYTIFTPLLNPVIYTLRNKDVKNSMRKLSNRWKTGRLSSVIRSLSFTNIVVVMAIVLVIRVPPPSLLADLKVSKVSVFLFLFSISSWTFSSSTSSLQDLVFTLSPHSVSFLSPSLCLPLQSPASILLSLCLCLCLCLSSGL